MLDLSEFQNVNGKHLESIGFFEGKNVTDLLNHLTAEVNEVRKAWDESPNNLLYFDGENRKPEGVAAELADVILLALDTAHFLGIDLATAIKVKNDYNIHRRLSK